MNVVYLHNGGRGSIPGKQFDGIRALKAKPIFSLDAESFVSHKGGSAFHYRWYTAWDDSDSYWWLRKVWWAP